MRLSDAGEYTCLFFVNTTHPYIIDGRYTTASTNVTVVYANISEPYNVSLISINSSALHLTWKLPSGSNIISFNYTCTGINTSLPFTLHNITTKLNITLTELQPFREYKCSVNTIGTGSVSSPSISVNAVTSQAAPSGPPLSFSIIPTLSHLLVLYWSPPVDELRNGIIISYTYYCSVLGEDYRVIEDTVKTTNVITNTILEPFTDYECFVSAATIGGSGPPATAIIRTNEDVPSPVRSVMVYPVNSNTSLYVTWSPPSKPNGIITNYTITVSNIDIIVSSVTVNGSTLSVLITEGLDEYIPYSVSVRGSTSAGRGNESLTVAFIKQGVPPTIEDISVHRINVTSLDISWAPLPLSTSRGFITSYTVVLTGGRNSLLKTVSGSKSNVVFTNISGDITYTVSIFASTIAGTGDASVATIEPINYSSPTPPDNTIEPINSSPTPPDNNGTNTAVIAILVCIIIVLIILVIIAVLCIALVYILKKRQVKELSDDKTCKDSADIAMTALPISVDDTANYDEIKYEEMKTEESAYEVPQVKEEHPSIHPPGDEQEYEVPVVMNDVTIQDNEAYGVPQNIIT
jgi:hypothetical protein